MLHGDGVVGVGSVGDASMGLIVAGGCDIGPGGETDVLGEFNQSLQHRPVGAVVGAR